MRTKVPVDVLGSAMQGLWRAQPMTGTRERDRFTLPDLPVPMDDGAATN
jgi:hypothetical protein